MRTCRRKASKRWLSARRRKNIPKLRQTSSPPRTKRMTSSKKRHQTVDILPPILISLWRHGIRRRFNGPTCPCCLGRYPRSERAFPPSLVSQRLSRPSTRIAWEQNIAITSTVRETGGLRRPVHLLVLPATQRPLVDVSTIEQGATARRTWSDTGHITLSRPPLIVVRVKTSYIIVRISGQRSSALYRYISSPHEPLITIFARIRKDVQSCIYEKPSLRSQSRLGESTYFRSIWFGDLPSPQAG